MTAANPKVVEAVTTALIERLRSDPLIADMVAVGQTPVDRVLAARRSRPGPVVRYPDREALAFTLFATDNRNAPPEVIRADYDRLRAEQAAAGEPFYVDPLADAAIEAFRLANS